MRKNVLPNIDHIKECVTYDPDTGFFVWLERPREHFISKRGHSIWNARYAGKVAGTKCSHAVLLRIDDKSYAAHRIAWLLSRGSIPSDEFHIDHFNKNPWDNRIANLREASHADNLSNRGPQTNNTSGVKGVCFAKTRGHWKSQLWKNGVKIHNEIHKTKGLAAIAYAKASLKYHGKFSPFYRPRSTYLYGPRP